MVRFVINVTSDLVERANDNLMAHRKNSDLQLQAVINALPAVPFSEERVNKAFADAMRESTHVAVTAP